MKSVQTSFASAEIELVIHATEDAQKILQAIESVIGVRPDEFGATVTVGHFGNEIKLLKTNFGGGDATELAYRIAGLMNKTDRQHMHDNFELYTDEKKSVYVRISKQKLFEGKMVLSQTDSLKIKFKAVRRFRPESELADYKNFLVQED